MTVKTRKATNSQTGKPVDQDPVKEDNLNKLAGRVVSKEPQASDWHVAKKEESIIVNVPNVRDAISWIPYVIEDTLSAMMTPGPENDKPYGYSLMAAMMQFMVDKKISAIFESVDFGIRLRQTIDETVSSHRYHVKLSKALFDTEKFLEPVTHVVKTEDDKLMEVSS